MKYIKTFESVKRKFWKVRTSEPFFTISLQKLGLPDEKILQFHNEIYKKYIDKSTYVYVFYHIKPGEVEGNWVYSTEFLDDGTFSFMGGVDVTLEDIDNYKVKKDANKYNL